MGARQRTLMDKDSAEKLAALIGGDAWQSGGGIYVVLKTNSLGQIIGITDESICVYKSDDALNEGMPEQNILLY